MKKIFVMVAAAAALVAFKPIEKSTWSLDKAHAKLGFTATHMMVSDVEGWFKTFDATLTVNKEDYSDAQVDLTAEIKSINTEEVKRDEHLCSPDFFDAAKFPTLTFKSKSFKKVKDNTFKVTGDLTMHGVTKSVELDAFIRTATNPMNKKSITGVKVSGVIKRSDFTLGGSFPTAIVSDEITLIGNAEFIKN